MDQVHNMHTRPRVEIVSAPSGSRRPQSRIMKSFARCALLLMLLAPSAIFAQVGSTTDIIMGRVTSPEGAPLAGARVLVTSSETQITRAKTTDANGRYSVLFPDGGGSYRIQVNSIGYAPQNFNLIRQSDEDRLVRDVVMGRNATSMRWRRWHRASSVSREPTRRPHRSLSAGNRPTRIASRSTASPLAREPCHRKRCETPASSQAHTTWHAASSQAGR